MRQTTTPRSYTLNEIDRMREAIRCLYSDDAAFYPEERNADIDNRVRTCMAGGIAPEELEKQRDEQILWGQQHGQ